MFRRLYLTTICSCLLYVTSAVTRPSTMKLQNNQYTNVVVALHDSIAEDKTLIDTVKDRMTKASQTLFKATKQRAYFKEIVILVPSSWSNDPSYGTATSETIYQADVVITDNFRKRRSVHTRSYNGCGQPGIHVLLNKEFLTLPRASPYFNSPEKYFIHAFAQFRWGVYQEYAEEGETPFYISLTSGRPEAIRCVENMRGLVQKNDKNRTICYTDIDPNTGVFSDGCMWRPYPYRQPIKASMMDFQFINEIETFCDDNITNRATVHNYEAPSKHNRLCEHRSVWDVIQNTADFRGGINPAVTASISQLTPSFRVLKATSRKRRAVIAVDTEFLENLDKDSMVTYLGRLKREADRHSVPLSFVYMNNSNVHEHTVESTNDIQSLLTKLSSPGTRAPTCHQMSQIEYSNHTVIFCDDETLDKHSGSIPHGTTTGHTLIDKLRHTIVTDPTAGPTIMVIKREDYLTVPRTVTTDTVHVDNSLQSDLQFIFHYEQTAPVITIHSPSGRMLTMENADRHEETKEIVFDSKAEPGEWTYAIESSHNQSVSMVAMAKVGIRDDVDIRLIIDKSRIGAPYFRLFVDVTQFHHPVVGLNVTASVETPSGERIWLQLLDNGAGADMLKEDGVYSRYFTNVRDPGHYHVSALIFGHSGHVYRKEESFEEETIDFELQHIRKLVTRSMLDGTLQRHVGGHSVSYERNEVTNKNGNDVTPPSRITDLAAQTHVLYRNMVVLQFTSPGNDLDFGKVSKYEVYIGEGIDSASVPEFISYAVTSSYSGKGRITKKVYNGKVVAMETEYIYHDIESSSSKVLVFGIVGVDEAGNRGKMSNIVTAKYHYRHHLPSKSRTAFSPTIFPYSPDVIRVLVVLKGWEIFQKMDLASKRTRVKYNKTQSEKLERVFEHTQYPDTATQENLATDIGVATERISIWFQNRRSKFKRQCHTNHVSWMRRQIFLSSENKDCLFGTPQLPVQTPACHVLSPLESQVQRNDAMIESSPGLSPYGANTFRRLQTDILSPMFVLPELFQNSYSCAVNASGVSHISCTTDNNITQSTPDDTFFRRNVKPRAFVNPAVNSSPTKEWMKKESSCLDASSCDAISRDAKRKLTKNTNWKDTLHNNIPNIENETPKLCRFPRNDFKTHFSTRLSTCSPAAASKNREETFHPMVQRVLLEPRYGINSSETFTEYQSNTESVEHNLQSTTMNVEPAITTRTKERETLEMLDLWI